MNIVRAALALLFFSLPLSAQMTQNSGGEPGGPAGGDLTGSYPNPTLGPTQSNVSTMTILQNSATANPTYPAAPLQIYGNTNSPLQINLQNLSNGNNASGDLVITSNFGGNTSGYLNVGINGAGYSQSAFSAEIGTTGYITTSDSRLSVWGGINGGSNGGVSGLIFGSSNPVTANIAAQLLPATASGPGAWVFGSSITMTAGGGMALPAGSTITAPGDLSIGTATIPGNVAPVYIASGSGRVFVSTALIVGQGATANGAAFEVVGQSSIPYITMARQTNCTAPAAGRQGLWFGTGAQSPWGITSDSGNAGQINFCNNTTIVAAFNASTSLVMGGLVTNHLGLSQGVMSATNPGIFPSGDQKTGVGLTQSTVSTIININSVATEKVHTDTLGTVYTPNLSSGTTSGALSGTFTTTLLGPCIAGSTVALTVLTGNNAVNVQFHGSLSNGNLAATTLVGVLVDGTFVDGETNAKGLFSVDEAVINSKFNASFSEDILGLSAAAHNICLTLAVSAGTGTIDSTSSTAKLQAKPMP